MRTWIRPIAAAGGLLVLLLVGPGMAFAQEPAAAEPAADENPACVKPDPTKKYTFNFHKIEVEKLAAIINQITCKRIIFEEKVRQKLTIFSQDAVTAEEAFELFQAALDAGGQYTLIPFRGGYKIVLTRDSKGLGIPTTSGRGDPSSESMIVTQMVRLKYVDAAELAQVFQQLISRDASIVPYPPTNTLIITDTGANIRRLLDMVAAVDVQESEQKIEVLTLQYAAAADIAEKVAQILAAPDDTQGGGNRTIRTTPGTPRPPTPGGVPGGATAEFEISPGKQAKILPYERTNSIIVVAGQAEIEKVKELVRQLDFDAPPGRAHFNVVHLRYARADEIVEVLAQLLGGGGGGGGSLGSRSSRRSLSGSSSFGSSSSTSRFGSTSLGGSNVAGIGSTLGGSTSSLNRGDTGGGVSRAAAEAGEQFTGQVSVTADPATNSLLVSASPEDFRVLRPVIDELDVRRKQVFVEAAILEVALNDSQTLGVQASSIVGGSNALGLVRSSLDATSPIGGVLADPVNNFPIGFGAAITSTDTVQLRDAEGNVVEVPAAAVLIQALAANSNVNVLSTPHILTTDNEEAQIIVGQQVPFPTGTVFSNGGVNPVQTVERQDVGLTLRITPQISDAGYIRLDIFQEVSAVVPSTDTEVLTSLGPTTTKRSAETRVVVKDDQTVVIGGLIQDRITTVESKIPYLGDIPYLGWLFSVNTDRSEKVNLMILLTPRVVREDEDVTTISNNKRQDTNDFYKGSAQVNPLEDYIDRLREQYPPQRPHDVPEPRQLQYTPPRTLDGRDNQGIEGSTYSPPGAAPGAPIPTGRGSVGPGAATAPSGRALPTPSTLVIPPPPPAPTVAPPSTRLDVTPEPDLSSASPPPAARPTFDTRGAEAPTPGTTLAAVEPAARTERAGTIRAALGPVPPPGFESSPLELTLQTAAAKSQKVVGLLVFVDGDLIFSRHADTGVLESPAPITLFVNGLAAGEHEVKVSLDVSDPKKRSQEVTASFPVVIPTDARKVVRAKVLEGKGREASAPTILWTESEEAA